MHNLTITDEDIKTSIDAVKKYMCFRSSNKGRHEAWITASSTATRNIPYYGVFFVCLQIVDGTVSLIIEGTTDYYNYFLGKDTEKTAKFSCINGTLVLSCMDRFGNEAEIDIKAKD